MFGYISGQIFNIKPTKIIVKAGGVGFLINCLPTLSEKARIGINTELWVHTAVRENSIDLYGFEKEEELKIFESLLTVSGVGPKSALSIIAVAGVEAIEEAVATSETEILTKVSGIGRKTANKIILELSGKLTRKKDLQNNDIEVFEALKALGYREKEIQEALKQIPKQIESTNEKIKYSLKNLGR
jgi:Holliday junction DNA helicase RuvA